MEIEDSIYNRIREKYNPHIPPLKKIFKKSGFFSYFFMHRPKIKKWNNNSDLIIFKYAGIKMQLATDFKARLDILFFNYLLKLDKHIKNLIKNGWKMSFISIYEYNILINFKKFYDIFYQIAQAEEFDKSDFLRLERAYIKITYRQYYVDAILHVFEKYLITNNTKYMDNTDKYDNMLQDLKLLFAKSSLPHSIRELIQAYNVTDLKSFYTWSEIFPSISTEIIQKEWYNCDREVYTNLIKYFKSIRKTTKALLSEKEKLLRLKENCILDEKEAPPILVKFYKSAGHNWILDNSDYYLQFLLISEAIIKHLDKFIFREWEVINNKEQLIRRRIIDDDILPSLYRKLKRELDMAFAHFESDTSPSVSVDTFRNEDDPEVIIKSKQQKKMNLAFNEILNTLFEISYCILAYEDTAIQSGYTQYEYLKFMLESPQEWIGHPVFSLFNYYIELIWSICGYFNHETFKNLNDRLLEIDKNLEEMSSEKDRIDAFNILESTVIKQYE